MFALITASFEISNLSVYKNDFLCEGSHKDDA